MLDVGGVLLLAGGGQGLVGFCNPGLRGAFAVFG